MASSGSNKSNKSDLVAIYRLEFYKNKKKWKLFNENKKHSQQSSCEPQKAKSTRNLKQPYDVEPRCESEKETSPLNNAFLHEIPTDDAPEELPAAPPPTPQPAEGNWQHGGSEPDPKLSNREIWINSGTVTDIETLHRNSQILETDAVQQSNQTTFTNLDQPVNNLQWLRETNPESTGEPQKIPTWEPATNTWTSDHAPGPQNANTQWTVEPSEMNTSSLIPQNIWTSSVSTANNELFHQNSWSTPTSISTPDSAMLASLLKRETQNPFHQKDGTPIANCLQMLLCPDRWNKQETTVPYQDNHANLHKTNTNPVLTETMSINNQELDSYPDSSTPPSQNSNQENWFDQPNIAQKFPLGSETDHRSLSNQRLTSRQELVTINKFQESKIRGASSPDKYPQCDSEKVPNMWINPALSPQPDGLQYNSEGWQKDLRQNSDQEYIPIADNDSDSIPGDDSHPADLQYSAADQNTLKPQGSLDSEMLTPEQIRRSTDEWLRRLLAVYQSKDCNTDFETASDHHQEGLNDSIDFIREAHEVPHSSEKDLNETRECACLYFTTSSLPLLSSRRLSAAIQHSTRVLREVLREQLIRDRLRALTLQNVIEYPTRDTELFGSDYVMGGSHLPPRTAELTHPEGGRLIRIDMGRPYRL